MSSIHDINNFPEEIIKSIGKSIIAAKHFKQSENLSGEDWEKIFSKAINTKWYPSNNGLGDIKKDNCCWSAKSIKNKKPNKTKLVRLISGRNSPIITFNQNNSYYDVDTNEIGEMILKIWNQRVKQVYNEYDEARIIVLIKSFDLVDFVLFETELKEFNVADYVWEWNKQKNLEGHNKNGDHCFTWQPSGSQFTILQKVPKDKKIIHINTPNHVNKYTEDDLLELINFDHSWIK